MLMFSEADSWAQQDALLGMFWYSKGLQFNSAYSNNNKLQLNPSKEQQQQAADTNVTIA